jgi:hypothetical protein
MPTFKRVKLHATVETEAMLLSDDQIDGALGELRAKLQHLDLAVLSVEPTEPLAGAAMAMSQDGDPWSVRGQPVD